MQNGLEELLQGLKNLDPQFDADHLRPIDAIYLYRLLLGRAPDEGGWRFWVNQPLPLDKATAVFMASDEARARWSTAPLLIETKRGISIFVDPRDTAVGRAIRSDLDYEAETSEVIANELRGKQGTFVDVGSNIGWYLLLAHSVAPDLRLVGFEPNPWNVELCLRSLQRRGLVHAAVHSVACSDREQFLTLRFVGSNGAVSEASDQGTMVKGMPADSLLKDEEEIRLVKLDVEGHEPQVIVGMLGTIRRHKPVLATEFHPQSLQGKAEEYLRTLLGLGYELAVVRRGGGEERETRCSSVEDVMTLWRTENERAGLSGELHLDLICRPTRSRSPFSWRRR